LRSTICIPDKSVHATLVSFSHRNFIQIVYFTQTVHFKKTLLVQLPKGRQFFEGRQFEKTYLHRVSKKTSTHIIGYKLRNSCPILIIFDIKIPHII